VTLRRRHEAASLPPSTDPPDVVDLRSPTTMRAGPPSRLLERLTLPQIAALAGLWDLDEIEVLVIEETRATARAPVVQLLLDLRRERLLELPPRDTRRCPRCSWPTCPSPDEPGRTHG
jgi:hypothetical protein